ncbi:hypothetical protein [Mesorhizobium sp. M0898]|uniref:hypothetical protein n=1 Tax=Mesorhizobium sp. M0898 TaxID=2957020 RepID=UPI00333D054B
MDKIIKRPVALLSAFILAGLAIALWIARAPTSYTGKLPVVGDKFPIELNAVYFIVFGPIVAMACSAFLWVLTADGSRKPVPRLLRNSRGETALLMTIFFLIFALSTALSLQYFLILAPESLCASRPHFDFLWTNVPGPERITHCMSGTKEINNSAPYYLEPQILQSWAQVLWPLLTLFFLVGAWRARIMEPTKP